MTTTRRPPRAVPHWLIWVAAGYVLRVALMPLMGQHDVLFMPWMARLITCDAPNLYATLYERYGDAVMTSPGVWAPYPYGFWAGLAAWVRLLDGLGLVDLAAWEGVWQIAHPARVVYLSKLPALLVDLGVAWGLARLAASEGERRVALLLWAWAPAVLYTPYMMGQNDMLCAGLLFGGVAAASRALQSALAGDGRRSRWAIASVLLLGLGGTVKVVPLLLLPVLVPFVEQRWPRRLGLLLLGLLPFVAAAVPFLGTPTFVEGVLLNREGISILAETDALGRRLAPFMTVYLALVIGAWARVRRLGSDAVREDAPVLAAVGVLGTLFLLVETAFYWLVWLAPCAVLLAARRREALAGWLATQVAFAALLLFAHEELAAGLPIHLSDEFRLLSVPTVLWVRAPRLGALVAPVQTVLSAASAAGLAVLAAAAVAQRARPRRDEVRAGAVWLAAPALLLCVVLGLGLQASSGTVRSPALDVTGRLTLSASGTGLTQRLEADAWQVNGLWLRVSGARNPSGEPVEVRVTLREGPAVLAAAEVALEPAAAEQHRYVMLPAPVALKAGGDYALEVAVTTPGAAVDLQWAEGATGTLTVDGVQRAGQVGLGVLRRFRPGAAWADLVARNVLGDPALVALLVATASGVVLFVGRALPGRDAACASADPQDQLPVEW